MDIIGLIKSALLALTAYLELKSKAFYFDMVKQSRENQQTLIDEIEKLRNSKSDSDQSRADILRDQLLQEKRDFEYLSTTYSLSGKS